MKFLAFAVLLLLAALLAPSRLASPFLLPFLGTLGGAVWLGWSIWGPKESGE